MYDLAYIAVFPQLISRYNQIHHSASLPKEYSQITVNETAMDQYNNIIIDVKGGIIEFATGI